MSSFDGLLFGRIADRHGRKLSMTLAVGLASLGSLAIGVSPTYGTIGIAAAGIPALARLAQGVAHGGELPLGQTYIIEYAPTERRGKWSSVRSTRPTPVVSWWARCWPPVHHDAVPLGDDGLASRIPFIIGGVLGLFVLWMRSRMEETEVYEESGAEPARRRRRRCGGSSSPTDARFWRSVLCGWAAPRLPPVRRRGTVVRHCRARNLVVRCDVGRGGSQPVC